MQDTVLSLVKRTFTTMVKYLLSFKPSKVVIENPNKVKNIYEESEFLSKHRKNKVDGEDPVIGLFLIDLVKTQND